MSALAAGGFVIGCAFLLLPLSRSAGAAGSRAGRALPRNGLIAFESGVTGGRDVFVIKPDGSHKHRLTHGGKSFEPRWSPDGQRIVFVRGGYVVGTPSALWVMNADGSGQRRLIAGHSVNTDPRWSPDGRSIAFTHGTPCSDNGCKLNIWLIRPDGTGARPLTRDGGSAEPSWSPDGKKIVFDRYNAAKGRSDLYVMNADGTGSHPLTSFTSKLDVSRPAWSPDGRTIAFIANAGTLSGGALGFIGADGKHPKPINSGYALDAPAWSPDGNWIVFEVASGGAQGELWAVKYASLSPSRPVCFDANGEVRCAGTPVDLPDTSFNPDWQPLP